MIVWAGRSCPSASRRPVPAQYSQIISSSALLISTRYFLTLGLHFFLLIFILSSSSPRLLFVLSSSYLRLLFVFSSSSLHLLFVFPSSSLRLLFVFSSPSLHPIFIISFIANMSKIVVCFDGTGNSYQGNTSDTNIVKLYQKLDRTNKTQFHYYQRKSILSSAWSLVTRVRASCWYPCNSNSGNWHLLRRDWVTGT